MEEVMKEMMPRHWEKAQGRGGRAAPAAPAESSNDATVLTTFLEYMETKREHAAGIWTGRRTGLLIDEASITKDGDGHDNVESFFNSVRLEDGSSTPGGTSAGPSTPGSGSIFSAFNPGSGGSSALTGGPPQSTPGVDSGRDNNMTDLDDDDQETETDDGRGSAGGGDVDFDEEGLSAKRLEYSAPKPSTKGAGGPAAAAATVARSDVSTDEELAATGGEEGSTRTAAKGGGVTKDADDEDADTETEHHQSSSRHQHQHQNGATPSRKSGRGRGGKSSSGAAAAVAVASSSSSPKKGKGTPGSAGATPTRAASRRGRRSGGKAPVPVSAVLRSAEKKERNKNEGEGGLSSDDNNDDGGVWDPTDFGEGLDDDDDAASPWSEKTPVRLPFTGGVGSATPRSRGRTRASSSPSTPAPTSRPLPPTSPPPPSSPSRGRSSKASPAAAPTPRSTRRSGGGGARDKSPPPTTPKSPSSAKGKRKGKGKDRAGEEGTVNDVEQNNENDGGFGEDDGDDDGGGGAGMVEFGGNDDDDDDGMTPFSPPSDGDGGGDGDESERKDKVGGGVVSSPVTRAVGKAKEKKDKKKTPAAAATKSKKKAGDHHRPHHRKGRSVVARLSVGRRKRAAAAPEAATPGPPRRMEGPRFVEMSEVAEVSHTPGVRRSSRPRVAPLKFWRGDNIVYGVDDEGLPVAEGIVKGQAVPERASSPSRNRGGSGAGKKRGRPSVKDEPMSPLSPSKVAALRGDGKKFKLMDKGDKCVVWDEDSGTNKRRNVVASGSSMGVHPLSPTHERPPGKEKVGAAAQAFSTKSEVGISEWLSGRLQLPPGAIKDSESVTFSTQIYVVAEGQPNALELAIAMPQKKSNKFNKKTAQRFLLSPGDHFFVPVNNIYRLENHSDEARAVIYWTIVKATTDDTSDEDDGDGDDES